MERVAGSQSVSPSCQGRWFLLGRSVDACDWKERAKGPAHLTGLRRNWGVIKAEGCVACDAGAAALLEALPGLRWALLTVSCQLSHLLRLVCAETTAAC